jgi:lipid-A-disaccharide synthase
MAGGVRIAMVAGEASGDLLGAHLIGALKRRLPDAHFYGIGGPKMVAAGFDALFPAERLAVRGYAEVLRHYFAIAAIRRRLRRRLIAERPDAFVGIDAPDFNLGLERSLKARGIPTIHYVSPSIWAWRGSRIGKIGRAVTHMLVLFPFEPGLYQAKGIPVTYVGHPLADVFAAEVDMAAARERLGMSPDRPLFALLPGSRQSEVEYMGELMIETARQLHDRFPHAAFIVPFATGETRAIFEAELHRLHAEDLPIRLLYGHAHDAMAAANVVLVASGTATLEAALLKKPMVIAYRLSRLSYWLLRRMSYLPYVGLPNILARRFVVPEFIQDDATPRNLAQALGNLATDRVVCDRLAEIFRDMHDMLRQNAAEKAAAAILPHLSRSGAWNSPHRQPA